MIISNIVTALEGMVESCKDDIKDDEKAICRCRLMSIRQFLIATLKIYDEQDHESNDNQ